MSYCFSITCKTAIFTEFQDKLLCYGKVDDTKQWTESSGPFETQEDAYKEVMRCVLRHDALTLPKTSDTELYQYLSLILPTNEQGQVEVKSEHAEIICDYVDTRVRLEKSPMKWQSENAPGMMSSSHMH